jgi:diguanylate cyclase (GGDEF)-like protein
MEAARVIRSVFPGNSLAARIGGDEFAVLVDEDEEVLAQAYQKIRQALQQYNAGNPELPLSISVGYAADHASPDLTQVFREADNNMYREKLKQSQEARDAIIEALKFCSKPNR